MEKNKDAAAFLQDAHRLPYFPGGDSGPGQASLWATFSRRLFTGSWQDSAPCHTFPSSRCCMPGTVLGPSGVSSVALVALVAFWGRGIQSRDVGTCVLNTCRFCLLVSPCCLQVQREGGVS